MRYLIPKNKITAIRKLARECANFDNGECYALDDTCVVQQDSIGIICKYYMVSVLPADPELHRDVLLASDVKDTTKKFSRTCKTCGVKFKAVTKQTQYCDGCQAKAKKERTKRSNANRKK